MKKRSKKLLSVLLLLTMVFDIIFNTFIQGSSVYAESLSRKINFDTTMKVNNSIVDIGSTVELSPGDTVDFELNYSADNLDPIPKEGDEFKFKLPEVFKDIVPAYPTNHFKDMKIENNTVILTCGPDIDSAIGGYLKISARVDQVEHEVPGKVIININGTEITIDTSTDPPDTIDRLIDKKVNNSDNDHTINPDNTGSIIGVEVPYSIAVNEKYTKMDNAVLTDNIPEGMELVEGSVSVKKVINGQESTVTPNITSSNPLIINLGNINHKHIISYKVRVTENKEKYVNTATVTSNNTDSNSDTATAVPKPDISGDTDIDKSIIGGSTVIDPDNNGSLVGKTVKYQVNVNSKKTLKNDANFTDKIPEGMMLVKDSVQILKEERGKEHDVTAKFANSTIKEDNLLEIKFGDISHKYIINYQVEITDNMDEYKNEATLVWEGGSSDATSTAKPNKPEPGKGTINKKVNGKDIITIKPNADGSLVGKTIRYSILVNNELTLKNNLKLLDNIPEGMELMLNSVKVSKDVGAEDYKDITNDSSEVTIHKSESKLEVDFGHTSERYRVEYRVKITETMSEYENTAKLTWDGNGSSNDSAIVKPSKPGNIGKNNIVKSIIVGNKKVKEHKISPNEDGIYDQQINYQIVINDKFESKNNTVFTDKIPEGMILNQNSIKVERIDLYGNKKDITEELFDKGKIEKTDSNLKISLGDIKEKYIVTYSTKITEYMPDGWKNDANLTWTGGKDNDSTIVIPTPPTPGTGTIDKTISNNDTTITPDENGSYVGQKIDYSIIVNNELEEKTNLILTDNIPDGMKVNLSDVKVFRDTGNQYEDITNKGLVTIKVNDTQSQLVVEFGDTSSRYKVEYNTEITENKEAYINNAIVKWDGGKGDSTATTKPSTPTAGENNLTKKVNGKDEETVKPDSSFIGTQFDYELLVNDKLEEKPSATLTDKLPTGIKLVPDSIKIFKDHGGDVYGEVTDDFKDKITVAEDNSSFTIEFGLLKDRYKITYKAEITELVEAGYTNVALLTYNGDKKEEADATIKVDLSDVNPGEGDDLLHKTSENTTVSEIGDKVKYSVKINEKNKRLLNLQFEDNIPEGMKLLAEGFRVIEKTDKGEEKDITEELLNPPTQNSPKATLEHNKLTINFGYTGIDTDTYSSYTIDYICEVTELKSTYNNTAKIIAQDVKVETQNVLNYEVSAGGINATKTVDKTEVSLDEKDQNVVYSIKVWSNAVFPEGYLKIEDKLDERLNYQGFEAPDFMDVKYDKDTHTVKITNIKDIPPADKEKALEVKIKVGFERVGAGETVENVAKINDKETPPVDVKKAYKFEGIKVDGDNNNAPLAGVKFKLYKVEQDKLFNLIPYGNREEIYIKDLVSDKDGKISSSLEEPGKYLLKEIEAPSGYETIEDVEFEVEKPDIGTIVNIGNIVNYQNTSQIKVTKVDEYNKDLVLEGAEFTLKKGNTIISTQLTNNEGIAIFEDIKPGTYTIEETKAPEGYIKSEEIKTVNVELGDSKVYGFEFTNIYNGQEILVKKVDTEDANLVLAGAEFTIKNEKQEVVKVIVTDDTGIAKCKLQSGKYTIEETKAPQGYIKSDEIKEFEVKAENKVIEFVFENSIVTGAVELYKLDRDNNRAVIKGAKFRLLGADKVTVVRDPVETDEEGRIIFDGLRPGTYYFQETEPSPGYILDDRLIEVKVDLNQVRSSIVAFENSRKTGSVELLKVDKDNNNSLIEGAEFQLLASDKKTVVREATATNKEGKIVFSELRPGIYYLQETEAAPGYVLDDRLIKVEVIFNQQTPVEVTFENSRETGSVELLKVDKDNNNSVIEGAMFQLLGEDKETVVREAVATNKEGKIVFEGLKPGTYYFQETKPALGYVLDDRLIEVVVDFNQQGVATVEFENSRETGSVELLKVDRDNNNSVIEGAMFQLLGEDKETVVRESIATNKEGKIVFNELKPGTYYFQETEAAPGYVLDDRLIEVVVDFNQEVPVTVTFENKKEEKIITPVIKPENDSPQTSDTSMISYTIGVILSLVLLVGVNKKRKKTN